MAIAVGVAGIWGGIELGFPDVATLSMLVLGIGLGVLYFTLDQWYCAMCGQVQGRVVKPKRCDRCDSNRMTKQDPGVGDAVRMKR